MPIQAVLLVLVAAVVHATWNYCLKKVNGGDVFIWVSSSLSSVLLFPLVVWFYGDTLLQLSTRQSLFIAISGALHMAYSMQLQRAYAKADLSVVYPLARGTGPLLTVFAAVFFLNEQPSMLGWSGVLGVIAGALLIGGADKIVMGGIHNPKTVLGVKYGVLTGLWIAAYSFVDGYAIKVLFIAPLVLDWLGNVMRALLLTPTAWVHKQQVIPLLQRAWRSALVVGVLAPTSYILVLSALKIAPLSAVAPARELSMLVGAFMGAKLLAEGELKRRMAGAACIVFGVACLAIG